MRLTPLFLFAFACNGPDPKQQDSTGTTDSTIVVDSPTDSGTDDADGDGVLVDVDCDDNDAAVGGPVPFYVDADGDSYGNATISSLACEALPGFVANSDDCNDLVAAANPGATEICDGIDNDCDAMTDDGDDSVDTSTGSAYYADADADGFGDAASATWACAAPTGLLEDNSDCDDTMASVNPDAAEVCNGIDDNCDTVIDLDALDLGTFGLDADGDGFGDASQLATACSAPTGYVGTLSDCDDSSALTYPGASETCTDTVDYNCDGSIGRVDNDGDGYAACEECDDRNAIINPAATETCNGIDDNCDGATDEGASGASTWYLDADADGYGDVTMTMSSCSQPTGYVADGTDCNDADLATHPGATETCTDTTDFNCDGSLGFTDNDGDGFAACLECDDSDALVNPSAVEMCDGLDNNCDGATDEATAADASTWYLDADSDGYGGSSSVVACDQPTFYIAVSGDCDDGNRTLSPAASEVCDNLDNDCDGLTDDADTSVDLSTASLVYMDADGDTYGDASMSMMACSLPSGYVTNKTDCNDTASGIYPGASELCNNMDDNCNGTTDESTAIDAATWYVDADGDGYGSSTYTAVACNQPTGYVSNSSDCDDTDGDYSSFGSFYADADGDGYGDPNTSQSACTPPGGYVSDNNDCDDTDASKKPGAPWYQDSDADGFGNPSVSSVSCTQPSGYVHDDADCNDNNASVNPSMLEACDGVDNDCDGLSDDNDPSLNVATATTFYIDADKDSYGSAAYTKTACVQPSGYVSNQNDCDDANKSVNPAGQEICDSGNVDEDCDGLSDDNDSSVTGKSTWYADTDGDTYGLSSSTNSACDQPSGYVSNSTDCNDTKSSINPAAQEVCDSANTDEDCDGLADDNDSSVSATGKITVYRDADGDTYGDSASTGLVCDSATGYVSNKTDCDDANKTVNPGATEICDTNNVDEDCDGLADDNDPSVGSSGKSTWYRDGDGDSYGLSSVTKSACDKPTAYVLDKSDCNDNNSGINPGAQEVCDASDIDEDCDNLSDDNDSSASGKLTWYKDADGDTYGNLYSTTLVCEQPSGYVGNSTDCDDTNALISPAGQEICDSANADEDCDGLTEDGDPSVLSSSKTKWYYDADLDGYGGSTTTTTACEQPAYYYATATDCNDLDLSISPAATEICGDGIDNNCDNSAGSCGNSGTVSVSTATTAWYGEVQYDYFGFSSNFIGDMNGDGYDDAMVGAYGNDAVASSAGSAYILYGSSNPTGGAVSASTGRWSGATASDYAGYSVDGAGDVNGDGYDDAIIGAYGNDLGGSSDGAVWLIYGQATKFSSSTTLNVATTPAFVGNISLQYLGYNMSPMGDFDKDGYDDFVLGGWNDATGPIYLVFGKSALYSGNNSVSTLVKLTGESTGYVGKRNNLGYADLNGDTYSDLAAGANTLTVGSTTSIGGVYIILGGTTRPSTNNITTEMDEKITGVSGNTTGDTYFGQTAGAGDYNNDGYEDLMIGGYYYDSPYTDAGAVWIVPGKATGWSGTVSISSVMLAAYTGVAASDYLGYSVQGLGDVDGDTVDDILMSAYLNDGSGSSAGASYVFYGKSSRSGTVSASTADFIMQGKAAGDYLGYQSTNQSRPGDMNNDGFNDILVNAYYATGSTSNSGAVYLFKGKGI